MAMLGLGLAAPRGAVAQSTADVPVPGELIAGPVLVGGAAVGVDSERPGHRAIRAYRTGQPPQPLPAFDALRRDRGDFHLAGSGSHLAVARDGREGATAALLSGPLDGPATLLARCPGEQSWLPLLASGDRLIFNGPGDVACRTRSALQGRDLSADPPATFDVPAEVPLSDFSWPYAAWMDREKRRQLVVYDLSARAEAYRVRIAELEADSGPVALTVDSDGTVVAAYAAARRTGAGRTCAERSSGFWASPAAPTQHPLTDPPCHHGFLKLRGGRLIDSATPDYGSYVLRARTLPAGAPRAVSAPTPLNQRSADFDGRRVAYVENGCRGGARIIVDDVDEALARGPHEAGSCPLSIAIRPRPLDRRGRIPMRITCPYGCSGEFIVVGGGHRFDLRGYGSFDLPAGITEPHVLRLASDELGLLKRLGQVRARVTAIVRQPSGENRLVGRRVTLRYPR